MMNDGMSWTARSVLGAGIVVLLAAAVAGGIYLGQTTSFQNHASIATPAPIRAPAALPLAPAPAKTPPDLRGQVAALEGNPTPAPAIPAPAPANPAPPLAQTTPPQAANPGPPPRFDFRDQTQPPPPLPAAPIIAQQQQIVPPAPAVDVNIFSEELQPLGDWIEVPGHQHCWRPRGITRDWRPYTVGHWAYTPDGLVWTSTEPWGDICYHYGSWIEDAGFGWVWVPGRVWAPAWVAWRSGPDSIGWAPLPPELCTGKRPILQADVQIIPAATFCFVPANLVLAEHLENQLRPATQNADLVAKTINVTNLHVVNNVMVNDSIDAARLEKVTHQKVERVAVQTAIDEKQLESLRSQNRPLIYTPKTAENLPAPQAHLPESNRPADRPRFTPEGTDRAKPQDPTNQTNPPTKK